MYVGNRNYIWLILVSLQLEILTYITDRYSKMYNI